MESASPCCVMYAPLEGWPGYSLNRRMFFFLKIIEKGERTATAPVDGVDGPSRDSKQDHGPKCLSSLARRAVCKGVCEVLSFNWQGCVGIVRSGLGPALCWVQALLVVLSFPAWHMRAPKKAEAAISVPSSDVAVVGVVVEWFTVCICCLVPGKCR